MENRDGEAPAVPIPPKENTGAQKAKKLTVGIILVFLIALSQVGASQFAKSTYQPGFHAPFFITWFNAVWMIICYPLYFLCAAVSCTRKETLATIYKGSLDVFGEGGLTLAKWVKLAGLFSFLAVGTNYSYLRALNFANPSDVTAIFASNSAFVFLLSCLILGAQIVSLKIIAVILAIVGIVLFSYSDGFSVMTFTSVGLAVLAAFGAALYIVLFKKVVGNAKPHQVSLFLSTVASFTLLMYWPMLLILHYSDTEIISGDVPWKFIGGSCALSIVFNFLINYGTAYTYPLFIAFGGIVGVPLNHVADWLFRSNKFDALKIAGTLLIIAAFVIMVTLPAHIDKEFYAWVTRLAKRNRHQATAAAPQEHAAPEEVQALRSDAAEVEMLDRETHESPKES
ncbi:putative thiamine transporter SLC35F3 [Paramacrobiotus metropolitanus]|uniref:putative thiamine transporter SLC35F3 n=1 Tax=Paramacrobiotus metropolitanus TaxID=2943436 RepID=UPI0024458551|nr:putative thiamine transporter SLC35F3 [Paramacrobiotus metropolitanus]